MLYLLEFFFPDERLSEIDLVNFKANHDSFLHMTSVKAITQRSTQRGVLTEISGKSVIERFAQEGPRQAIGTYSLKTSSQTYFNPQIHFIHSVRLNKDICSSSGVFEIITNNVALQ